MSLLYCGSHSQSQFFVRPQLLHVAIVTPFVVVTCILIFRVCVVKRVFILFYLVTQSLHSV